MIEVRNLVKRYGSHCAVDHLSFTVESGQVFGFLGPNGAGKSTTMNMITGYLAPTEGEVLIDGYSVQDEPEKARACVGYLPEIPPLYPEMTVDEYLRFAAELKKIPKDNRDDQVKRVMELTHLSDMAPRLIQNLSKGYRQRVGLAQALLGFPDVLILDEPTAGLDPRQVVEIRALIRQLARDHTILISSHILSEIRAVCDQVLIIRKGKSMACDTPERLEAALSAGGDGYLRAKGRAETVQQLLLDTADVSVSSVTEKDGCTEALFSASARALEALFYAFAQARCPIVELRPRHLSLEEVFLDLTDEDDARSAQAAALLHGAPAQAGETAPAEETTPDPGEDADSEKEDAAQ
jgi:ABC-2 type transport system ATP-binding protein